MDSTDTRSLGPNGAGKSTTISLIRGDIQPSRNGGQIFVDDVLVSKDRAKARSHLGVCPQFDGKFDFLLREPRPFLTLMFYSYGYSYSS